MIGPQAVEVMKTSLDISAALDKAEYIVGENATLRMQLKNLGQFRSSSMRAASLEFSITEHADDAPSSRT